MIVFIVNARHQAFVEKAGNLFGGKLPTATACLLINPAME
jgi:hypothetical protein